MTRSAQHWVDAARNLVRKKYRFEEFKVELEQILSELGDSYSIT